MTTKVFAHTSWTGPTLVLGTALMLIAGCYPLDPGHIGDVTETRTNMCFDDAQATLVRYSSRCGRTSSTSLTTIVGEGVEFTSNETKRLDAPCSEGVSPAVEVYIEPQSLLFDFSNVESSGRFSNGGFDGYVIEIARRNYNGTLGWAMIDLEQSTLLIDHEDIYTEADRVEVNFADVAYDAQGFVKIDLVFVDMAASMNEL
mgnify:FL=1